MIGPRVDSYLAGNTGHTATPRDGTYFRESDGQPADVLNAADYPVGAVCKVCGGRIRLGQVRQWDWQHAPAQVTA